MNVNLLFAVIDTLNKVDVHGEDNLDKMLGCIQTLKKIANDEVNENG